MLSQFEIEALEDGVEIYRYASKNKPGEQSRTGLFQVARPGEELERVVVQTLSKGEKILVGGVSLTDEKRDSTVPLPSIYQHWLLLLGVVVRIQMKS